MDESKLNYLEPKPEYKYFDNGKLNQDGNPQLRNII